MNNLWLKLGILVTLCALCAWRLTASGIRYGKDLQGGVSLVYAVRMPADQQDPDRVLGRVIDVLKQRVNPQGVLDIGMTPQGNDRIEVVMPLPSAEVRALQQDYRARLDALVAKATMSAQDLQIALLNGTAAAQFGGSDATSIRATTISELQRAYDESKSARAAYDALVLQQADAAAISTAEDRVVLADNRYEPLLTAALAMTLDRAQLHTVLELSSKPLAKRSATGELVIDADGKTESLPSARESELARLRGSFSHLASDLDALVVARDAYVSKRTSLDDPEDLMRLMRGAGVLDFRIAVNPKLPVGVNPVDLRADLAKRGPAGAVGDAARWFKVNDLKQWAETPAQIAALEADAAVYFEARGLVGANYGGVPYLLLYDTPEKSMTHAGDASWGMANAFVTTDQRLGGKAVGFVLDPTGAEMMGRLTAPHVNQPMAIVLDDEVYSAPNLNSAISGSGTITGNFGDAEIDYLIRVLTAGSLEVKVGSDPISMSILGPSIGADNLTKGLWATVYSVALTCIVMLLYYFVPGIVADLALAINALLIFGIMSTLDGTFTLPGLAGDALSVALPVDATELIYERIREELEKGERLKEAIKNAYSRALSAIVDGNVTNLIACVVLYNVGATEVKGFALTMSIGVFTTLFTGLWVTRLFFNILTGPLGVTKLPMLPSVVPAVSSALRPHADWVKLKPALLTVSSITAIFAVVALFARGNDIFETEFRGGVAMTLSTRAARPGEQADAEGRLLLHRADVEARVRKIGEDHPDDIVLRELRSANVLTLGAGGAESNASSFQIRAGNPSSLPEGFDESKITENIVASVVREFANDRDMKLPLAFAGAGSTDHRQYTKRPDRATVGESIGRPNASTQPIGEFRSGVAVVIDSIDPPVAPEDAAERIMQMRLQPEWSSTAGRKTQVVPLAFVDPSDPSKGATALAVLVTDPAGNWAEIDAEAWDRTVANEEWKVVSTALSQQASLDQVSSFSPVVAQSLAASALVATVLALILMLGYIWIRFGSFRFSAATVVAVSFNVIVCLGFLAISIPMASTGIGSALYIEEYRIDINVIAGLLTIIGYSLNDTVVILDRVRENRGKRSWVSRECLNDSINQTFSRTVLTGGSTLATAIMLIAFGGTGIRPFAYTFLIGLIAGTFSSVAIAAPLAYSAKVEEEERKKAALAAAPKHATSLTSV